MELQQTMPPRGHGSSAHLFHLMFLGPERGFQKSFLRVVLLRISQRRRNRSPRSNSGFVKNSRPVRLGLAWAFNMFPVRRGLKSSTCFGLRLKISYRSTLICAILGGLNRGLRLNLLRR